MDSSLKIAGEVELSIDLHLLASAAYRGAGVKRICAHQQALAQCRNWLDQHWPAVERVAVSSNGEAARMRIRQPALPRWPVKWPQSFTVGKIWPQHMRTLQTIPRVS